MKTLLILSLAVAVATAQPPPGAPRQGPPPPLPAGFTAKRDVQYVPDGGPRRMLDVYFPAHSEKALPLVVWIHGGGWRNGSKDRTPALPLLADGFAVASVTYRFSQDAPFPAQIEDCKAAIRWFRAHAKELNLDPTRIGVWGSSAGGHLVAMLGTAADMKEWDKGGNSSESSRVQAVCDWFGPAEILTMGAQSGPDSRIQHDSPDSPEAKLVGGPVQENKDKARTASPLTYVSADDPPFLIMHGDRDALVPLQQSVDLQAALKKAGVDSTLRTLEGSGHGDGGFRDPAAFAAVKDFFVRTLKK